VEPPIFAAIQGALSNAKIPFTHDSSVDGDAFLFFIDTDYFPQARMVFDKLKSAGRIRDYEVKEK
jgi:hypothetical protein